MRCKVAGITHNGEGVARIDGKATFVPFGIPGEELEIEIIEDKPRYSRGIIKQLHSPSPDRVNAPCPYYYDCGGCSYQHAAYPRQLVLKQQVVNDALKRIGQVDVKAEPVIGMSNPWHYRNKVTWHVGEGNDEKRLGYYLSGSRKHLPIQECLLLTPEITELSQFLNCYLTITGVNTGKRIIIRQSSLDQKLMLIIEGPVDEPQLIKLVKGYPGLDSVFVYENNKLTCLDGAPYLNQQISDCRYKVSPLAFFQVNNEQTKKLYDLIKKAVGNEDKKVLDAYCGTGSIAVYIANQSKKVVGLEIYSESIKDAKRNAKLNKVHNTEFHQGACEKVINNLKEDFDTIILDPPRSGCHPELLQKIADKSIKEIIYVSCNPATLARDVKILSKLEYEVQWVQPVDMFAQTGHVESVVLMQNCGTKDKD